MRASRSLVTGLLFLFLCIGCQPSASGPPSLVSLSLSPSNPSIAKATTQQFTAKGTFSDDSIQDVTAMVVWGETDLSPGAASIDAGGLSTGQAVGQARISASYLGQSASTSLTVTAAVLTSLAVSPSNPSLALSTTQQFTATGAFSDGTTQDLSAMVGWSSSDQSPASAVASISATGLATAQSLGRTTIAAALMGKTAMTGLTVTSAALTSLAISPSNPSLALGTTQQFVVTGTYTDGSTQNVTSQAVLTATDQQGQNIASITAAGVATAKRQGQAGISAALLGKSVSTAMTVTAAALTSLAISPSNLSLVKGTTQPFVVTGTYTDGTTQDVTQLAALTAQDVSGTNVASISSTGLAAAKSVGQASISAAYLGRSVTTALTVTAAPLTILLLTPSSPSIAKGTTQQFSATGIFSDGTMQNVTASVIWTTADIAPATAVASIGTGGLASGNAQGQATVKATLMGQSASTVLTVTPAVVTAFAISPSTATLPAGVQQQYTATATYSDGTTQDVTATATWTAADMAPAVGVATINAQGLATALKKGGATISASYQGFSRMAALTVGPAVLTGLSIAPLNASVRKGTTQLFFATGLYSDGTTQVLTNQANWTVADVAPAMNVASIAATGLLTANNTGKATVSAVFGMFTAQTTVQVIVPTITSITLSPSSMTMPLTNVEQVTATALYSDGTTQVITNLATWTTIDVSGTGVAAVSVNGQVRGLSAGAATVRCAYMGLTASIPLQVNQWTVMTSWTPPSGGGYFLIGGATWGLSSSDLWVLGSQKLAGSYTLVPNHWNGTSWTFNSFGANFNVLTGSASNDAWFFDNTMNTTAYRWDGTGIYPVKTLKNAALAAWTNSNSDVWCATNLYYFHWDGTDWTQYNSSGGLHVYQMWGSAANDVWAVGNSNIDHWDGTTWTTSALIPGAIFTGVWGSSRTDVWASGPPGTYHYDGTRWSLVSTPAMQGPMWGASATDIWAVGGSTAQMVHYDGKSWQTVPTINDPIVGLWGAGPSDVWLTTANAYMMHYP